MPQGAICAEVQCSKSTVSRLKQKAGDTGRSIGELLQLPDDEFVTIFGVRETTGTTDPRKEELLRMMPEIMRRLGQKHAHMQYVNVRGASAYTSVTEKKEKGGSHE